MTARYPVLSPKGIGWASNFGTFLDVLAGDHHIVFSHQQKCGWNLDFIFKDRAQALRYRTSPIFKDLWEGWNKATGQTIQSAGYFGAFNVTSNIPVEKPSDMINMKIRVPDAPIWLAFPRAVGANPTPVALAEVYLALQQGLVNASANPLPITYAFKFYEVQKYVNPTAHMMEYVFWITGKHVTDKIMQTGPRN